MKNSINSSRQIYAVRHAKWRLLRSQSVVIAGFWPPSRLYNVPFVLCLIFPLLLTNCTPANEEASQTTTTIPVEPTFDQNQYLDTRLTREVLHDKILGMLVGSAIGDAMGAPTEMWPRKQIEIEYGFVDSLDKVIREPSPEGPWAFNLSPGGTTDDTRWKKLTVEYLLEQTEGNRSHQAPVLDARKFASFIVQKYRRDMEQLKATDSFDPEPFEVNARKMTWLQEWALVAKPYMEKDLDGYALAVNRFYGGEMACAGMLYAPAIGAFYPGRPEVAYEEAFKLSLFDIGYARDITGLTAAMTAAALSANSHPDSVMSVIRDIDPHHYFKSRLLGRTAYRFFKQAKYIAHEVAQMDSSDVRAMALDIPRDYRRDSLQFARTQRAYERLEDQLQDIPFHAGEIFLVNATALLVSKMDFALALEFVINFARDNDTTGAVTGAILGAYHGFDQLPDDLVERVLATNKNELEIDLEDLATKLTNRILERVE